MSDYPKNLSQKLLLTYDEAAFLLNVSKRTVQHLVASGKLEVIYPGPRIARIPRTSVDAYVESLREEAAAAKVEAA